MPVLWGFFVLVWFFSASSAFIKKKADCVLKISIIKTSEGG